jgi:DNA-3-methyladenine glycosylase
VAPLPRAFFARPADVVAPALLGQHLVVQPLQGSVHAWRITEAEAYLGAHDLACHSARGRTARTEVMFGPPGHLYVYFIYGMHDMLNVTTGQGAAVLIRGVAGTFDDARGDQPGPRRRNWKAPGTTAQPRTDGPGRLTRTLGITRRDNGLDATVGKRIWFEPGPPPPAIQTTPRIGVDYAGAWAKAPLRFVAAAAREPAGSSMRGPDAVADGAKAT